MQVCHIVAIEPQAVGDLPIQSELAQWLDELSREAPHTDLGIILAGQTSEFQRDLKEAIGLAYFGLGEDQLALPLLEGNQSQRTGGLFARAAMAARQVKIDQAQKLYEAGVALGQGARGNDFFDPIRLIALAEIERAGLTQ